MTMFHEGDLQSGVARALQESKPVVCFVSDGREGSTTWENEWLQEETVSDVLIRQAVVLKLEAGSQEAGFLSAFCPVTDFPTILVINQGQLSDQLTAGVSSEEFRRRLLRAISGKTTSSTAQSEPLATAETEDAEHQSTQLPQTTEKSTTDSTSQITQQPAMPPSAPTPQSPTPNMQDMWAERRSRLEAQRKKHEAEEKAKAAAAAERAKTLQKQEIGAASASGASSLSTASAASRKDYIQQQAQRKREAKQERDRVLKLLEFDKQERKRREEARKDAARAEQMERLQLDTDPEAPPADSSTSPTSAFTPRSPSSHTCALQIRLFDGSTIRASFPSNETLAVTVRPWIDHDRTDGSTDPYAFKQVRTPRPSRTLSESDETQSLGELGLAPNATLVLVPGQKKMASLLGGARGAAQSASYSAVMPYVTALITYIINMIRVFLGIGNATSPGASSPNTEARTEAVPQDVDSADRSDSKSEGKSSAISGGRGPNVRIRTLRDQRAERGESPVDLYNGNQLNFEARKDNEDEEED